MIYHHYPFEEIVRREMAKTEALLSESSMDEDDLNIEYWMRHKNDSFDLEKEELINAIIRYSLVYIEFEENSNISLY